MSLQASRNLILVCHYLCPFMEQIDDFYIRLSEPYKGSSPVLLLICVPHDPNAAVGSQQVVLPVAETKCGYGRRMSNPSPVSHQGCMCGCSFKNP